MEKLNVRNATLPHLEQIMEIFEIAKNFMRSPCIAYQKSNPLKNRLQELKR